MNLLTRSIYASEAFLHMSIQLKDLPKSKCHSTISPKQDNTFGKCRRRVATDAFGERHFGANRNRSAPCIEAESQEAISSLWAIKIDYNTVTKGAFDAWVTGSRFWQSRLND